LWSPGLETGEIKKSLQLTVRFREALGGSLADDFMAE
jgi:hypothetical protein